MIQILHSITSNKFICHYLFLVAPHIERENLQKKIIRSGQSLKVIANIRGEPPPKVVWKVNGDPINNNRLVSSKNKESK